MAFPAMRGTAPDLAVTAGLERLKTRDRDPSISIGGAVAGGPVHRVEPVEPIQVVRADVG